jgi:adenylate kinase family enzyme
MHPIPSHHKELQLIIPQGPPASGKGSLCKRLAENHPFLYHLSAGDYLRHLINGPLSDQPKIVEAVRSGGTKGLVKGDVIVELLLDKVRDEMENGKKAFVLDGFPRNLEQDEVFKVVLRKRFDVSLSESVPGSTAYILILRQRDAPDLVISISCPKEVAKERYLGRKRGDDSEELFGKRYSDYEKRDMKVVELYRGSLLEVSLFI